MRRFPFGQPATPRPPRVPVSSSAALLVLGVYPSALHVRWRRPDGVTVGALPVDDEPTVFWDGGDAASLIERWQQVVGWTEQWGSVTAAGGNGSSGRHVVNHVLKPLGIAAQQAYFTDCLPTYFIKSGENSQMTAIRDRYEPFAVAQRPRLPRADLPVRPSARDLVHRAVAEEGPILRARIAEAAAPVMVTLGQEAADVLAELAGVDRVLLTPGADYGRARTVVVAGLRTQWIPLVHPGNRSARWRHRHQQWVRAVGTAGY
ncbi:uracil-DNA glycosylase family protein [Kibdelosporangium lantanae]|uniref:Uracil-DNA glycosylase family protein n=1 Tax=Kibdelosporangium lantanae TaxID=1497396 RepID=A0ABW3M3K0_9PSEU